LATVAGGAPVQAHAQNFRPGIEPFWRGRPITSIKLTAKPELKKKKVKENAITKMLRKARLI
jgi:hypothetical protein